MMIVVLVTCLYTGWAIETNKVVDEIGYGSSYFRQGSWPALLWKVMIRFVCPAVIVIVFLNSLGVF